MLMKINHPIRRRLAPLFLAVLCLCAPSAAVADAFVGVSSSSFKVGKGIVTGSTRDSLNMFPWIGSQRQAVNYKTPVVAGAGSVTGKEHGEREDNLFTVSFLRL